MFHNNGLHICSSHQYSLRDKSENAFLAKTAVHLKKYLYLLIAIDHQTIFLDTITSTFIVAKDLTARSELSQKKQVSSKIRTRISVRNFTEWL